MMTRRKVLIGAGAAALTGTAIYTLIGGPSYEEAAQSVWRQRQPRTGTDLEYLAHYATLAANSHNTQAWRFSRSGSRVAISPDLSRATPAADADNHHLFASLGCACENLTLAATAAGQSTAVAFTDDGDGRIDIDLAGKAGGRDPLFDAILERQCTRSLYDGREVAAEDMKRLEAAAQVEGCRVILIPDRARIDQALDMVIEANTAQVQDPAFVAELKSWLRFNARDAIEKRDGLYSGCSGNPALPTWLGEIMFDFVFKPKSENDRYASQIRSSAGLAVFVSDKDDKAHWVQAGRSYQRFALQATALGIRHAFINQPVEVATVRPAFAAWAGIGNLRPDLVVRYGYALKMPKSLRRPLNEVVS